MGIIPDIEVKPTIEGIRQGRDEVLEAALSCELVSTENIDAEKKLILYPNPAHDWIHFELPGDPPFKLEIYDIKGRNMKTTCLEDSSGKIDISSFNKGIYFLRVTGEKIVQSQLLVKN